MFKYLSEVQAEMQHVRWPTRQQSLMYTLMVVAVSAVTAAYLGAFDYVFSALIKQII